MGDKIILKSGALTAFECLTYSLSLPTSVVITGIDKPEVLDQAFKVANSFQPLRVRSSPRCCRRPSGRRRKAPTSCSRARPISTKPRATQTGWDRTIRPLNGLHRPPRGGPRFAAEAGREPRQSRPANPGLHADACPAG
ncbi:MAG TPA: hypothetical protein VHY76_09420 [Acetobacteraceae bacterium]|nr:hypothetical protein [Acetobacteraceae bacterium]